MGCSLTITRSFLPRSVLQEACVRRSRDVEEMRTNDHSSVRVSLHRPWGLLLATCPEDLRRRQCIERDAQGAPHILCRRIGSTTESRKGLLVSAKPGATSRDSQEGDRWKREHSPLPVG